MKRFQSITDKALSLVAIVGILVLWQVLSATGVVPAYLLPAPSQVFQAFIKDFPLLMDHAKITLLEAFLGLFIGTALGFIFAVLMDWFEPVHKALYPLLVVTQTVPTVAIAPLLVLWFGYGITPKVVLIVLTTFFPIAVGLFDGFRGVDQDAIRLLKTMGAGPGEIFRHIKLPGAVDAFFSALKISAAYSIVGAVISEWLGGFVGLGVYITRVMKSYSFDKMFAVIFFISFISLLLMQAVNLLHRLMTPWKRDLQVNDTK